MTAPPPQQPPHPQQPQQPYGQPYPQQYGQHPQAPQQQGWQPPQPAGGVWQQPGGTPAGPGWSPYPSGPSAPMGSATPMGGWAAAGQGSLVFDDLGGLEDNIVLRNVTKVYGQVLGVNDLSLVLDKGMTAIVGPNGAGKSTLFKLIAGLVKPTKGTISVRGQNPFNNPAVLASLGYCPDYDAFYTNMTGQRYLTFMARLHGLSASDARREADWALDAVELAWVANRKIGTYSRGMRQRIKIAQSILTDPKVLLLDEPFAGTDPLTKASLRELFLRWSKEGRSLLLSSHMLSDVETLTRRVVVLARGRVVAEGDISTIRGLIDRTPHRVWIETADPRALSGLLSQLPSVDSMRVSQQPRGVGVETSRPAEFYTQLPQLLAEKNIHISHLSSPDDDLDALFRTLAATGGFY